MRALLDAGTPRAAAELTLIWSTDDDRLLILVLATTRQTQPIAALVH